MYVRNKMIGINDILASGKIKQQTKMDQEIFGQLNRLVEDKVSRMYDGVRCWMRHEDKACIDHATRDILKIDKLD